MHLLCALQTMLVVLLVGGEVNSLTLLQLNVAFSLGLLVLVTLLRKSLDPHISVQGQTSQWCRQSSGPAAQAKAPDAPTVALQQWSGPQQTARIGKSAPPPPAQRRWFRAGGGR